MPERSAFLEELRRYYALWHAFDHTYEAWAKARGLSLNELTVLEVLCESTGDCTQKKICEEFVALFKEAGGQQEHEANA